MGDRGSRHIFNSVQACFSLFMCCFEAVQVGQDTFLSSVELGQGLSLACQGLLYLGELAFNFHNAACERSEIIG